MRIIVVTISLMFFIIQGCKQESIVENDLQFQEKLVVKGLLTAGQPIQVYFTKTLPLTGSYNPEDFIVKDVEATITNENKSYQLTYNDSGYYSFPGMIASNGESYELAVNWNGKLSSSQTTVPNSTQYQKAKLVSEVNGSDTSYYLQCFLAPRTGAVYGVTWVIVNADSVFRLEDDIIPELLREQDKNLLNLLVLKTRDIPNNLINKWRNSLFIRVFAFDSQYYNFFLTQNANVATTNIFNQSSINLRWNVKGDAIGMFVGETNFMIKVNQ